MYVVNLQAEFQMFLDDLCIVGYSRSCHHSESAWPLEPLTPPGQRNPNPRDAHVQLLVYLRLSRLQDPAQFPKIVFEKDIVVSQVSSSHRKKRHLVAPASAAL
jgi:hypothetical protein